MKICICRWQYQKSLMLLMFLIVLMATSKLQAASRQTISGHLVPNSASAHVVGRLPQDKRLSLGIGLPLRNREVLTNLLSQLYDPNSTQYHKWLTVDQFVQRFGPAEEDYEALGKFLESQGFSVTARYANRMLLDVSGTVADIERTFNISLQVYSHPYEARTYFAPDTEPSLDLGVAIMHVSGLDNFQIARPAGLIVKSSRVQDTVTPQGGSGPGGLYMGVDFRAAYASGVYLTGSGQRVGLLEFDGYYPSDITVYASMAGLTNVSLQNVLLDGVTGNPGPANVEVALDIEMALSMAPGLAGVIVYEGEIADSILNRMAVDDVAMQLSASWTFPSDALTTQIFQQFAAQGQSYFNASGDSGAYAGSPLSPTDNPYISSVGGTTLATRGPGQAWGSEKTWSWYNAGTGTNASSGGISSTWPIPTWQQGINMNANHASTTYRNIPDVAMVSDNVLVVADNGVQESVGGDSIAAPLWASFVALANQQAAVNNQTPVGFVNPAIYAIGKGSNYSLNFHDIKTGNNTNASSPDLFYATNGYDLCTGWGTPIGKSLINSLAPPVNFEVVIGSGASLSLETCVLTNGAINPGEPVIVNFGLLNVGGVNTHSLVATLLSNSVVQPLSGPQTYGILIAGGPAITRSFTMIGNGSCGGTINPTLQLQDGTNNLGNLVLNFSLGAPVLVFNQDFDGVLAPALPSGWTRSVSGAVSNWITTTSFRYTSPNSVSVVGAANPGVSELISPSISITTTSAQLSFWNGYVTEINPTNSTDAFDGGVLEIQIGGGPFTDIIAAGGSFVSGGYTRTLDATTGNPLSGRQAWAGTSGGFINTKINLPAAAAGQNINLKWRLATDIGNADGATYWYLDNILISDGISCCTPPANADLAVTQTVSPQPAFVGQSAAYSIAITNNGPGPAINVTMSDILPANSAFIYGSPGCVYSNGTIACSIPLLISGAQTNYSVIITPTEEVQITNTVFVNSGVSDPNQANNTSTAVTSVYRLPTITEQPTNQVVTVGTDVTLSISAVGTAPLSYQWSFDGTNLDGAISSALVLTNIQTWQSGDYTVTVTNTYGSATSDQASLIAITPPVIELSNLSVTPSNLTISLIGVPGVSYTLEYKDSLADPTWTPILPAISGNGLMIILQDTNATALPSRFYRVDCH